ncbi:MAG: sulfatase [Alphaproteobacteria bacterium]
MTRGGARRARRREFPWATASTALAPLLAAVLSLAAAAGCTRGTPAVERPNVLLLTVDTLRADGLGCYGGSNATPHVDRIAREGVLFSSAACAMPMTRPSLSSIHTGRHPRTTGVVNNAVALGDGVPTLASALQSAGWTTAAFVGVRLLDTGAGLFPGFETYEAPPKRYQVPASEVVGPAVRWIAQRDVTRPFFLWVHLFDPHLPYAPPDDSGGGARMAERGVTRRSLLEAAEDNGGDLPAATFERALGLYGDEIEYADRWIGTLLDALESRGLLDHTIVAFAADHGECFDHGIFFEHSDCLYDGAVKVPLLLRFPARVAAGTRVDSQVELMQLAPTLLGLAGVTRPGGMDRPDLFAATAPTDEPAAWALVQHPLYDERAADARHRKVEGIRSVAGRPSREVVVDEQSVALRDARWKMIRTGDHRELYDLAADPSEEHDVAASHPDETKRLDGLLDRKLAALPLAPRSAQAIDPRLSETLRALGYAE